MWMRRLGALLRCALCSKPQYSASESDGSSVLCRAMLLRFGVHVDLTRHLGLLANGQLICWVLLLPAGRLECGALRPARLMRNPVSWSACGQFKH